MEVRNVSFGRAGVDNVLQRMTIIGVLLSFRGLAQEALMDVSGFSLLQGLLNYCSANNNKSLLISKDK